VVSGLSSMRVPLVIYLALSHGAAVLAPHHDFLDPVHYPGVPGSAGRQGSLYGAACGALGSVLMVLYTALRGGEPSLPSLSALLACATKPPKC